MKFGIRNPPKIKLPSTGSFQSAPTGNDLFVNIGQDINVIGGALQSGQNMSLSAGRDVNVSSVQVTNSTVLGSVSNSSDVAQLGSSLSAGAQLTPHTTSRLFDSHVHMPAALTIPIELLAALHLESSN